MSSSSKNTKTKTKTKHKTKATKIKQYSPCPCGGGQSCIVDRREFNDWVYEDEVFKKVGLPTRKNCYTPHTFEQLQCLNCFINISY